MNKIKITRVDWGKGGGGVGADRGPTRWREESRRLRRWTEQIGWAGCIRNLSWSFFIASAAMLTVYAGTVALAGSARHYQSAPRICAGGRVTGKVRTAPRGFVLLSQSGACAVPDGMASGILKCVAVVRIIRPCFDPLTVISWFDQLVR